MATSYFRPLSMMATFSMATVVKMRLSPHHYQPRSALIHLMASSPSLLLHFVLEQSVLRPWSLAGHHRKQSLERGSTSGTVQGSRQEVEAEEEDAAVYHKS